MSDNCEICAFAKDPDALVYEDDAIAAVLTSTPATIGHILVFPKDHFPIMEKVPDYIVGQILNVANKLSTAIFESINIQGTNIIVQNGVPAGQRHAHCVLHLLPRMQNDGMDFTWQPKQLTEEEMSTIELQVKENTKDIGGFELSAPSEPVTAKEETKTEYFSEDDAENYLIRHLRRIP